MRTLPQDLQGPPPGDGGGGSLPLRRQLSPAAVV